MRINSRQAAQILGTSSFTIRQLAAKGKLTDLAVTQEGLTKHQKEFDLKEVRELSKVWKPAPSTRKSKPNGAVQAEPVQTNPMQDQMNRIESKLDELIQLWK